MSKLKFNRKQYMNKECTHNEYYSQFCDQCLINFVGQAIGYDKIKNSKDTYFNDIPLKLWDDLHITIGRMAGALLGQSNSSTYASGAKVYSLSDTICVAKAAAEIIRNNKQDY